MNPNEDEFHFFGDYDTPQSVIIPENDCNEGGYMEIIVTQVTIFFISRINSSYSGLALTKKFTENLKSTEF